MSLKITDGVPIPVTAPQAAATEMVAAAITSHQLEIQRARQEKSDWCWAACAHMVLTVFDQNVSQCDVASFLRETNCCLEANEGECNLACDAEDVLHIYDNFGVTGTLVDDTLSFSSIREEIRDRQQPVEVGIKWDEGGGHLIVVYGCSVDGTARFVRVHDPLFQMGEIRFSELRRYKQQGNWAVSWKGFAQI
jgi:hypothetical protein